MENRENVLSWLKGGKDTICYGQVGEKSVQGKVVENGLTRSRATRGHEGMMWTTMIRCKCRRRQEPPDG